MAIKPALLDKQGRPTGFANEINKQDFIALNCKTLASYIAELKIKEMAAKPLPSGPVARPMKSKMAVQDDFESDWARYWMRELHLPFAYYRKLWEWVYILQVLYLNGMLRPGKLGLGLGCGQEPLPCYLASKGCTIIASDQPLEGESTERWAEGYQCSKSLDSLYKPELMPRDHFNELVSLNFIDMNELPEYLHGRFDFCWSSSVVGHLGSIKKGLAFLKESDKLLKPGGVSVHIVDFNFLDTPQTMDNCGNVLFQKAHFIRLGNELVTQGLPPMEFDFSIGSGIFDRYVDLNPYPLEEIAGLGVKAACFYPSNVPHIKLWLFGFPSTSFGLIIKNN